MNINEFCKRNKLAGISFEGRDGKRETIESVMARLVAPLEIKKTELERRINSLEMELNGGHLSVMTEFNIKLQLDQLRFALNTLNVVTDGDV